jgi:hypothetical protein
MEPVAPRRDLFLPWLLLSLAAAAAVVLLFFTAWWFESFTTLGQVMAIITALVAVVALVALTTAFVRSVLLPIARGRRDNP